MTLLLTCLTSRFTVQASDRRLTITNGKVKEEAANKATLLCYYATFAYTGLANSSASEATDRMMMRALSATAQSPDHAIASLAAAADSTISKVFLPAPVRKTARRTSFVGCGFVGLSDPTVISRSAIADNLHPFLVVISNAQGLSEAWRPYADPNFTVSSTFLPEGLPFILHVAGQRLTNLERIKLERSITNCLRRGLHAEPVARLLARAIRVVSEYNSFVGPNVMCTIVRREDVKPPTSGQVTLTAGATPLVAGLQEEAYYFKRMSGHRPTWIYSPGNPSDLLHYGPNYACNGIMVSGLLFGPSYLVPVPPGP